MELISPKSVIRASFILSCLTVLVFFLYPRYEENPDEHAGTFKYKTGIHASVSPETAQSELCQVPNLSLWTQI
jgi:hypothetical protein